MRYAVPVWIDVVNIELHRKEELSRKSPAWCSSQGFYIYTRNVCAKQAAEGVPLDDHKKSMSGVVSGSGRSGERRRKGESDGMEEKSNYKLL